jgi:hypothetical protein
MYKFETLEVWELSLEYVDMIYRIAAQLPDAERFNLYSQVIRAGTSIVLNIAEGSTGQSDKEQGRFFGMAIRSLLVQCLSDAFTSPSFRANARNLSVQHS